MPRAPTPSRPATEPPTHAGPSDESHLFRLLRFSHIFSSTVRDVLELNLLREVTTLPLTLQQLQLIRFMTLEGRHRVGDVAGYLGVSTAAASKNIEKLHKMARRANTSIFVKNAPSVAGIGGGGEGYASWTIASPTGEGLTTAASFTRERRCTLKEYFRIV